MDGPNPHPLDHDAISVSLLTTDNCMKVPIIGKFSKTDEKNLVTNVINGDGRMILATVDNVLSLPESIDIIERCNKLKFENMSKKYASSQRINSRILVLDEEFASNLWKLLSPEICKLFQENDLTCQPLGFGVSIGDWKLESLNEAFRINKYTEEGSEFFSLHKDAQYCPNGDRRSLLTLLIYLNGDFDGGSTCFYFPKDCETRKDVSVLEEIDLSGGIENGYLKFVVGPSTGKAVIFSQNIIHESLPVTKGSKYVLKTDVIVKRQGKSSGFSVSESEREDYMTCLNYFREAQQQELMGNSIKAGELYERALSIRYCYPMILESSDHKKELKGHDYSNDLPNLVWYEIFSYLSGVDIENIIRAFPHLSLTQKSWERYRYNYDENNKNRPKAKYIPNVELQHGIYTQFKFDDADFFFKNKDGCLRAAAMYAFFLLSHKKSDQVYTVCYNPERQEVCAVSLKSLLRDAFFNRPCYGSIYAVWQTDPNERCPEKDFASSVDGSYMSLHHNSESVYPCLESNFKVETKLILLGDRDLRKEIADEDLFSDSDDDISDSDDDMSDSSDHSDDIGNKECGSGGKNSESQAMECSNVAKNISMDGAETIANNSVEINSNNGAETIQNNCAETVSNIDSETISNNATKTISNNCMETISNIGAVTILNIGAETISNNDAEAIQNNDAETISNKVAETVLNSGAETTSSEIPSVVNTLYEGYSESENSEYEISENESIGSDAENMIEDLKDRIKDVSDTDWFMYQYDCNSDIMPTAAVLKEVIRHSNTENTFKRLGAYLPERITERNQVIYEQFRDSPGQFEMDYFTEIRRICKEKPGVSVALISKLKKPVNIKGNSMCLCYWPGGNGFERIRKACKTTFYNHLVFDFLSREMKISEEGNISSGERCGCLCFYEEYFDAFFTEELDDCLSDFHYRIDITEIIKNNEGFNHASCNCHVPAFKITEFCDLKSYPYLNHIHLVGGEKDGNVILWAVYGGIAAL